jgi:hypothetical protein
VSAPAFVAAAVATTGKQYPENVSASRVRARGRWGISFVNRQPTVQVPAVGGRRAVARALKGRMSYFRQNLRRAVFSELGRIAQRYPGLKVQSNS